MSGCPWLPFPLTRASREPSGDPVACVGWLIVCFGVDSAVRMCDYSLAMNDTDLITDSQSLVSAASRFDSAIPVYDDGLGPLWIHRDSMGISGIIRAQTWEDAYSICEDEFFPAGDEEACEEMDRIEAMPEGEERDHAQACFDESYGFRGNSRTMEDGSQSSIYAKDLNGDSLDRLTPDLLAALEITLEIEECE